MVKCMLKLKVMDNKYAMFYTCSYQSHSVVEKHTSLTKSTYSDLYVTYMWLICHLYVAYKSHTSFRILVYVS